MAIRLKYPIQKKSYRLKRFGRKSAGDEASFQRVVKSNPRIAVPSFFTLMNLFSGFVSIITASQGNIKLAAILIVVAAMFDALDGVMARMANATSEFGLELDSISDVVSFGVAPGFLAWQFAFYEIQFTGIILAALPALCGAVRLARYNVDNKDVVLDRFRGLPIPAQAIMICAFVLTFMDREELFEIFSWGVISVFVPLLVLLSFLMVSTIPFDKLPKLDRNSIQQNRGKLFLFVIYLLVILFFQEYGLMAIFTFYIGKGLLEGIISLFFEPVQ